MKSLLFNIQNCLKGVNADDYLFRLPETEIKNGKKYFLDVGL